MHRAASTLGTLLVLTLAAAFIGPPAAAMSATTDHRYVQTLDIAPRLQWNANFGYCGETSLISAGMYFGQYTSQWTVRSLASPGIPQTEQGSQLLLGVNDLEAAGAMRLAATSFASDRQTSTPHFLTWVKSMALRNRPVIIGVFLNMARSGGEPPGDPEYDHIVPVLGVASMAKLSANDRRYRPTDLLTFSDNSSADPDSIHTFSFQSFQRSRAAANRADAPMYSLRNQPMNYAIAVTGVDDPEQVTVPVRLTSSANSEGAQDQSWLVAPPKPQPIELTATVTLPDPAMSYNVYLYDDFAKVPVRNFNASASDAIQSWNIPSGSAANWRHTITVMSDQTRVFRAVPVTAP